MERALLHRDNWPKTSPKAQVRRTFKEVFPLRNCFTLVRPVHDEDQLRNIEKVPFESLRAEFREELCRLLSFVREKADVKRVEGTPLDGRSLVAFVRQIASSLNEDSFPEISSVADRVGQFERKRLLGRLVKVYAKKSRSLLEVLPQSEHVLSEKLEVWKLEALAQAQSPWLKGNALKTLYKRAMKAFLQLDKDLFIVNVEKSSEECDRLAAEIVKDFGEKVKVLKETLGDIQVGIDDLNRGPIYTETEEIRVMSRHSLLTDVFPRSHSLLRKDTLQNRPGQKGKRMVAICVFLDMECFVCIMFRCFYISKRICLRQHFFVHIGLWNILEHQNFKIKSY